MLRARKILDGGEVIHMDQVEGGRCFLTIDKINSIKIGPGGGGGLKYHKLQMWSKNDNKMQF